MIRHNTGKEIRKEIHPNILDLKYIEFNQVIQEIIQDSTNTITHIGIDCRLNVGREEINTLNKNMDNIRVA